MFKMVNNISSIKTNVMIIPAEAAWADRDKWCFNILCTNVLLQINMLASNYSA